MEIDPSHSEETYSLGGQQALSGERLRAAIETGLIIVGLLLVNLLLPRKLNGDGVDRYNNLIDLIYKHILYKPKAPHSLIGPLFSTPLLLLGEKLGHPVELVGLYNFTLFVLCLLLSYFLLRNYVDRALLRKFFLYQPAFR
jgi:hypothetical protein